ncbi:MAG: endonuclease III domain-containing protein [Pseudomonadota bacterium]
MDSRLIEIFRKLLAHFGPRRWWPAETPFEVMVGAVLTQNTSWTNVEKAISSLKEKGLLSAGAIYELPLSELAACIRSAGYYNIKARRLKNLVSFFINQYDANLDNMFAEDVESLRSKLLEVKGIGPETADSILLYAGGKPSFVVDAYTKRVFSRHMLISEESSYDDVKEFFMDRLPVDAGLYSEFHALIVAAGKTYCKKNPACQDCPLNGF